MHMQSFEELSTAEGFDEGAKGDVFYSGLLNAFSITLFLCSSCIFFFLSCNRYMF